MKPPREYAQEITQMKTREQRREALEQVPKDFREWVRKLVMMAYDRSKAKADSA